MSKVEYKAGEVAKGLDILESAEKKLSTTSTDMEKAIDRIFAADRYNDLAYIGLDKETIKRSIVEAIDQSKSTINKLRSGIQDKANELNEYITFKREHPVLNFFKDLGGSLLIGIEKLAAGLLSAGEGILDAGAVLVGSVSSWFGNNEFKNDCLKWARRDLVSEGEQWFYKDTSFGRFLDLNSFWGEDNVASDVLKGVGYVGGLALMTAIPYLGPAVTATAAFGHNMQEQLQKQDEDNLSVLRALPMATLGTVIDTYGAKSLATAVSTTKNLGFGMAKAGWKAGGKQTVKELGSIGIAVGTEAKNNGKDRNSSSGGTEDTYIPTGDDSSDSTGDNSSDTIGQDSVEDNNNNNNNGNDNNSGNNNNGNNNNNNNGNNGSGNSSGGSKDNYKEEVEYVIETEEKKVDTTPETQTEPEKVKDVDTGKTDTTPDTPSETPDKVEVTPDVEPTTPNNDDSTGSTKTDPTPAQQEPQKETIYVYERNPGGNAGGTVAANPNNIDSTEVDPQPVETPPTEVEVPPQETFEGTMHSSISSIPTYSNQEVPTVPQETVVTTKQNMAIPTAAALSAAAAAGIGTKAYMDYKEADNSKQNVEGEENGGFYSEEWNGSEDDMNLNYGSEKERTLNNEDDYSYNANSIIEDYEEEGSTNRYKANKNNSAEYSEDYSYEG